MNTLDTHKKTNPEDWHRADVVAALHKKGWSLRKLSVHHGLSPTALKNALDKPWPKAEKHIADAIGITPWQIWPSRYAVSIDSDGNEIGVSNRSMGRKRFAVNDTETAKNCNVKKKRAA